MAGVCTLSHRHLDDQGEMVGRNGSGGRGKGGLEGKGRGRVADVLCSPDAGVSPVRLVTHRLRDFVFECIIATRHLRRASYFPLLHIEGKWKIDAVMR